LTLGSACASSKSAKSVSDQPKVEIKLFSFTPKSLPVNAGDSVVWNQGDDTLHTVTSGHVEDLPDGKVSKHPDATFDSGNLAQGATFEFSFEEPGKYTYFCNNHPEGMRGEVIVG
jgi:plastocyanin